MSYFHESLEKLPGVFRDQYGNLKLNQEPVGLRSRIEYVQGLPAGQLAGTKLADLLDWMRWGSECSVMWECTLPELIHIIEKWLNGNPDAPQELFGFIGDPGQTDWDSLWTQRGRKEEIRAVGRCRCGSIHRQFDDCDKCWQRWFEMETASMGPRGLDTYNLVLLGAGGNSVAAAVWNYRNWLFVEPEGFRTQVPELFYPFA